VIDLRVIEAGKQREARRRAVRWNPVTYGRVNTYGLIAFHAMNVDHVESVEDAKHSTFLYARNEFAHQGFGDLE
jgi:hypothetical protein